MSALSIHVVNNDIVTLYPRPYTQNMNDTPKQLPLDTDLMADIIKTVQAIVPCDDLEKAHQEDTVAWLKSGVNPFRLIKPDIPPKHLVTYFVLVDPKQRSILLVDHIKAQLWLPSGGHVEYNERPEDAVVREAREELNIDATFLNGNARPFFTTSTLTVGLTPGHTDVDLWYLLKGSVHDRLNYDKSEFVDVEWYTFDEILEMDPAIFDPHLQRFTYKLMQWLDN
jgi:8-oxo-dGTP diphosphatase